MPGILLCSRSYPQPCATRLFRPSSGDDVERMDVKLVAELLSRQRGVISRRQVLECDGSDNDIERLVNRREWVRVHPGVFIDHTGSLAWDQRAWAGVLLHWPAALAGRSALRVHHLRQPAPADDEPIEVAIDQCRHVGAIPGITVQRLIRFSEVAQMHLGPPRVRLEHAVLTFASRSSTEDAAVATVADACQAGRTTARRLVDTLSIMPRLPRRRLLRIVLDDVAAGAYSALERRYLTTVERPHGLPVATRQRRVSRGRSIAYRDVEYVGLRTVVELDGRLGHESAGDRWGDLARDSDSLVGGDITLRAGWKQVLDPCRLAAAVARLLLARGWTGTPRFCPTCPVAEPNDVGGSPALNAGDPPLS